MALHKGKIAWFNSAKGFGFINEDGQPDVFFHYSGIVCEGYKTIKDGQIVTFDVEVGAKGKLQAVNVVPE